MGLRIKNERVHALAREAVRRMGGTQTSAIERALERLLGALDASSGKDRRAREISIRQGPRESSDGSRPGTG
jgi:antitoxin VapB